ncbi:MAG: DUF222 domain-containing protein [Glaciihabitans sp.]
MANIPPPPDITTVPDTESTQFRELTDPSVTAYERRYARVQLHLDAAACLERSERTQIALRLREIEAGRREALATEYAYPRENHDTRATEPAIYKMPNGGPESADAVPTKWSADSVADQAYTAMVATTFTISHKAAEILVHTAQPLHEFFPRTLQLLEDGRTSFRHAQAVVDSGWFVPDEFKPEYEDILLPFAETLTPPQFANKAKAVAATYKEDPLAARHEEALKLRSLTVTPCDDGMANVNLYMDAVGAYAIRNRARAITRAIFRKEDGRSRTQVEADVASEILLTGVTEQTSTPTIDQLNLSKASTPGVVFREVPEPDSVADADIDDTIGPAMSSGVVGSGLGAGILAKVAIHVPALTLLEHGSEPAYLENYGPISIETALLLAGNAPGFTRILTNPDTGATLSVGTKLYKVPDSMRCWILFRDGTCRFPGCSMPAKFCDLDHSDDWQNGGETKVTNLVSLCKRHHMLKHNTSWDYIQNERSLVTWISPSGRRSVTEPANYVPVKTSGGTVVPDVGTKQEAEYADSLSDTDDIRDTDTDAGAREYPF